MSPAAMPAIVLATDSLAPSGVGEHMLTLADALKRDHRVVLAFPSAAGGAGFLRRGREAGYETMPIDAGVTPIAGALQDHRADLLHVHAGVGWEGHALAVSGWTAGIPIIRTEHLPYVLTDEDQRREHLLGIALVDRLIFVSEAAHESYRKAGACGTHATTIRNGIVKPQAKHNCAETRLSLRIPEDVRVLVTVARFTPQKGYEFLLRATSEVVARGQKIHVVLVGDGPDRPKMEALARELEISGTVQFLGEREDVADLLTSADLFVLPSLFEGLPLVILEAMALGLPVVATRIGGTLEALGADYPWLVGAGAVGELADMLSSALTDAAMRARLGERNERRYATRFGAERMASETAALYRAVLSEGDAAHAGK